MMESRETFMATPGRMAYLSGVTRGGGEWLTGPGSEAASSALATSMLHAR